MNYRTVWLAPAAAMFWIGFGTGGPAQAEGISLTTPAGLVPGDTFRFVFITDDFMSGSSSNIGDYNNFVNTEAGGYVQRLDRLMGRYRIDLFGQCDR